MVKEIRLKNFQAHKDTTLELHPGVNVITGSSNSGKSSILRAVNWVVHNRPSGDAFVSHWARNEKGKQTSNTLASLVKDSGIITRTKSATTGNTYSIDDKVLEAIGLDVPEEVDKAINFTEVNTQRQHDAPFLLSETPGEVARFFNKIVHFDAIDRYMSSIESKKRKTKVDTEHCTDALARLETAIAGYSWLDRAEELVEIIKEKEATLNELNTSTVALSDSIGAYRSAMDKLPEYRRVLDRSAKLIKLIDISVGELAEVNKTVTSLENSIDNYSVAKEIIDNGVSTDYAERLIKKIEAKKEYYREAEQQINSLRGSIEQYRDTTRAIKATTAELTEAIASLPKTCPTCGKELDECDSL